MDSLDGDRRRAGVITSFPWRDPPLPIFLRPPGRAVLVTRDQQAIRTRSELVVALGKRGQVASRRRCCCFAKADGVQAERGGPYVLVTPGDGDVGRGEEDDEPGEGEEGDYPR